MFDPNDQNTQQTFDNPASHSHSTHPSRSNPPLDTLKHTSRSSRKPRLRVLWGGLAFLILVLLFVVGVNSLGDSPNYFPPPLVQQLPARVFFLIGAGAVIVLALLLGIFRRIPPLRKPLGWSIG